MLNVPNTHRECVYVCNEEMATAAPSVIYVDSIQVEEKKEKKSEHLYII